VILDFDAGWTRMHNTPGLESYAESYSISPYGVNPLRYNLLWVPHHRSRQADIVSLVGQIRATR
jgi:hypothetical protein